MTRPVLARPKLAARTLALGAALVTLAGCRPLNGVGAGAMAADSLRVRADVEHLASDRMEGRATGTAGDDSAAVWAARRFRALRLDSLGLAGYLQTFTMRAPRTTHGGAPAPADTLRSQNVVAMVRGTDPARRDEYVVVGAHIDHLGRSPASALDPDARDAIRNGADDNASGTAAVLELARRLAARPTARSVVFALFSGEEHGLVGSSRFVANAPVALARTSLMVNFDMVGRLRDDRVIVYGVETAKELRGLVDSANSGGLTVRAIGDGYGPSDHSSFYGAGVPVLHFFTDLHDDYHRATDDAGKVSAEGIVQVASLAERVVRAVADRTARLMVQQTAPPPRMVGASTSATMPYFGSIPDMGAEVNGMRLTGVRPGSPADEGGLKAGDVVVKFGGRAVTDIYTYTEALQARRPGDVVEVEVLREGRRVPMSVTLTQRAAP